MQSRRRNLHWSSGKSKASWECALLRARAAILFKSKRGDPVCRGDILETTAGGKVGIRFIDGTAFNLSDSARAVVKEFGCDGAEPSALFDISRGTFAFIAGEMAKHGRLRIETPFASIRGRAQSGGIGMLSLASLFFAALENAQGATTLTTILHGTEDGIINIRDSSDIINAPFGIIELTVGSQTTFIDIPLYEYVVRGTIAYLRCRSAWRNFSSSWSNRKMCRASPRWVRDRQLAGPADLAILHRRTASVRDADNLCADGYGRSAERRSERRPRRGRNGSEHFHSAASSGRRAAADTYDRNH